MKKELKDYLYLYLGCKINTSINGTVMNGKWYDRIMNDECDGQLPLRPLGDMTQEYANELWEHLELNGDFMKGNGYRRKGYILKAFLDNCFEDIDDVWDFDLFNRASMKLRKDGFDCDGLIEAGLAIDKTTISNEN